MTYLEDCLKEIDEILDLDEVLIAHFPDDFGLKLARASMLDHRAELVEMIVENFKNGLRRD